MAPDARRRLGTSGEETAAVWLAARGYEILARNVRTRFGELDLVARQGDLVVFVEVKTRSSAAFGHPVEAVAGRKQARLAGLAAAFLRAQGLDGAPIRFDVVAVRPGPVGRPVVEHYPGAFEAAE